MSGPGAELPGLLQTSLAGLRSIAVLTACQEIMPLACLVLAGVHKHSSCVADVGWQWWLRWVQLQHGPDRSGTCVSLQPAAGFRALSVQCAPLLLGLCFWLTTKQTSYGANPDDCCFFDTTRQAMQQPGCC